MHKGTRHIGKVPAIYARTKELRDRLDELTTELDEAVTSENYEDAARLRDEIKNLETQITSD